jgi:hypothetical protein
MTRKLALFTALAVSGLAAVASAQDLKLPRPSQKAELTQTIGLTDIKMTYSRPGVKGRAIWGGLVPYDKVWRTGANEATTISFSTPVKIEGQDLAAGDYSLHTIPTAGSWTIIFNKSKDLWGSYAYNDSLDALRVTVTPVAHEATEWMTFSFPDIGVESATLALDWEKLRVPVQIQVQTVENALAASRAAMQTVKADDWRTPFRAADFAFTNNVALDEAATWIDRSVSIQEHWLNLRLKANMMAKSGNMKEAVTWGEKAVAAAKKDAPPEEVTKLETTVTEWKGKL